MSLQSGAREAPLQPQSLPLGSSQGGQRMGHSLQWPRVCSGCWAEGAPAWAERK